MMPQEAKLELKSYRDNLRKIAARAVRVKALKEEMQNIRIATYGERFGNNPDRIEEIMDKINLLQLEHSEALWAAEKANMTIHNKLEKLRSPYLEILQDIYIAGKSYEQVAVNRHYTYESVKVIVYRGIRKYANL